MKVLVTGSTGFLGSWLVKLLIEKESSVRVLIRREAPELEALGVECVQCDLSEEEKVSEALRGIDCVYHAAARPGVWGASEDYFRDNVIGTRNIISACKNQGVSRLVFTSSPSVVIGDQDLEGVDESIPYAKKYLAEYPRTKAIAEREILEANGPDLMTCALRPHLIWGPGDNHLIPRFLLRARQGRLRIVGSGNNRVDTVYVEDAARAHLLAAEKLVPQSRVCGSVYFISQEEPVVLFEWINRIIAEAGLKPIQARIPAGLAYSIGAILEGIYGCFGIAAEPPMTRFIARQLYQSHYFDHQKAREELGFKPLYSMEEAYQKLFKSEYFRELCRDSR